MAASKETIANRVLRFLLSLKLSLIGVLTGLVRFLPRVLGPMVNDWLLRQLDKTVEGLEVTLDFDAMRTALDVAFRKDGTIIRWTHPTGVDSALSVSRIPVAEGTIVMCHQGLGRTFAFLEPQVIGRLKPGDGPA